MDFRKSVGALEIGADYLSLAWALTPAKLKQSRTSRINGLNKQDNSSKPRRERPG